ncbi:hypothetical protein [Listeria phage LP-KV022]|uniref:Uncharacterized protein n=2 Tax=Homburgvirus LP110 TaxID=1921128 RepID=A0A5A4K4S5_9CAUD|nr:hypothetical protein LP110_040 [Listeria phage LP-110]AGI11543.1 hypothetical protein LP110_040 [Listeria phage LP-110]AWY07734.1 hypothetical protein [Listeria phage LP-KV022]
MEPPDLESLTLWAIYDRVSDTFHKGGNQYFCSSRHKKAIKTYGTLQSATALLKQIEGGGIHPVDLVLVELECEIMDFIEVE